MIEITYDPEWAFQAATQEEIYRSDKVIESPFSDMWNPKRTSFLLLFLALMLAVLQLLAQSIRVEGTVQDSGGAVVPGASVELTSGSYRANTVTDAQGRFVFEAVPAGTGTIDVQANGFTRVVNYTVPVSKVFLLGNHVAQVPRNAFSWEPRYWNPSRLLLSVQGRFVGNQFDDDQNKYPLGRFYTMDLQVGRNLTRNLQIFAAAENLLDKRYNVANTPTPSGSLFNIGRLFSIASGSV